MLETPGLSRTRLWLGVFVSIAAFEAGLAVVLLAVLSSFGNDNGEDRGSTNYPFVVLMVLFAVFGLVLASCVWHRGLHAGAISIAYFLVTLGGVVALAVYNEFRTPSLTIALATFPLVGFALSIRYLVLQRREVRQQQHHQQRQYAAEVIATPVETRGADNVVTVYVSSVDDGHY